MTDAVDSPRGIRRAKGIAPNGKSPILTPLLKQMITALPDDLPGLHAKHPGVQPPGSTFDCQ